MRLPDVEEFQKIYDALQDEKSRKIYKHRLLHSLFHEKEEINWIVAEGSAAQIDTTVPQICFYGAGAGGQFVARNGVKASFFIDTYKTGTLGGYPIISLEEFLELPDYKEYLVLITLGKGPARNEITALLDRHGIQYNFIFPDSCQEPQYFEIRTMCPDMRGEFFVDAGAFDGETTEYFLKHFEDGHAYVFEPNPRQYQIVQDRLRNVFPDSCQVELFPYGVHDENTTLRFDSYEGDETSARISESGDVEIEVRRLDDLLGGRKVTFLKMDIEGSELAALRGAERIIREQRPKLAICVYHKPEDMWEIPSFILSCHPDYKLYLRHHSMLADETVLYAV